jgi:hypothetical protein
MKILWHVRHGFVFDKQHSGRSSIVDPYLQKLKRPTVRNLPDPSCLSYTANHLRAIVYPRAITLLIVVFRSEAVSLDMLETPVLKLRVSALRLFTCGETLGFIKTRSVSEGFPATLRKPRKHNPSLTQRVGIVTNSQLQKAPASGRRGICGPLAGASSLYGNSFRDRMSAGK